MDNNPDNTQHQPAPIGFEMHQVNGTQSIGFEGLMPQAGDVPIQYLPPQSAEYNEKGDLNNLIRNQNGNNSIDGAHGHMFFNETNDKNEPMKIDYVLVYNADVEAKDESVAKMRKQFEINLENAGLVMESCEKTSNEEDEDTRIIFVKIHVPWKVLLTYAELMKMKMPLKTDLTKSKFRLMSLPVQHAVFDMRSFFYLVTKPFACDYGEHSSDDVYFTAPFRKDRLDMFLIPEDKNKFFTNAQRSRICFEVLSRTRYSERESAIGLKRLLGNETYLAAYPLHEGPYKPKDDQEMDINNREDKNNDRELLYEVWARPKNFYKYQPLDLIRRYFGEKIGIYFAWLGLYTFCLIPVSIIGIACVLYGLATFQKDPPVNEICYGHAGNYTMCPLCDVTCDYSMLKESCLFSMVTHVFDNRFTIAFAIIMSCWGKIFLEYWGRKENELQYDWDVSNFEEQETVRPEFEHKCKNRIRLNPITGEQEPYMPALLKCPRYTMSFFTIVFMVSLVLASVVGVVLYRVTMVAVFFGLGNFLKPYSKMLTSATAAILNLMIILLLNRIYRIVSIILTNIENPRTETEYEDKFTFKMYCFQFVNFYSSLCYIAFFKGSFTGRPGDYLYLGNRRQEECDAAGCLVELCIQMLIIFGGKQVFNNFMELGLPVIQNFFRRRKMKQMAEKSTNLTKNKPGTGSMKIKYFDGGRRALNPMVFDNDHAPQWEKDFNLVDVTRLCLFDEYLEMVIQFGFVTLFVSAMPLAPFFALCNNIIEVRLDAFKMLTQWRRPNADRAEDIGIWFPILRCVAAIAVVSNALILSYTSDAVPKIVYENFYSSDGSLQGYIDFTLSVFDVRDFQNSTKVIEDNTEFGNVSLCRYRGYRLGPESSNKYEYKPAFWHVLTARLAFILIFEHVVFILTTLIGLWIPDMSETVKVEMLRERYITQELMYKSAVPKMEQKLARSNSRVGPKSEPTQSNSNRNNNSVYPVYEEETIHL